MLLVPTPTTSQYTLLTNTRRELHLTNANIANTTTTIISSHLSITSSDLHMGIDWICILRDADNYRDVSEPCTRPRGEWWWCQENKAQGKLTAGEKRRRVCRKGGRRGISLFMGFLVMMACFLELSMAAVRRVHAGRGELGCCEVIHIYDVDL